MNIITHNAQSRKDFVAVKVATLTLREQGDLTSAFTQILTDEISSASVCTPLGCRICSGARRQLLTKQMKINTKNTKTEDINSTAHAEIKVRYRAIAQAIKVHFNQPDGMWWTLTQIATATPCWAQDLNPTPSRLEIEMALIVHRTECVKSQGQRMFRFNGNPSTTCTLPAGFCAKSAVTNAAKAVPPTSL